MTKFFLVSVVLILFVSAAGFSREVVGAFSTDRVVTECAMMSKPIMSTNLPRTNVPVKMITFPGEVVAFLEREGIDEEDMKGNFMTDEMAAKICSVCEGQKSEFCSIMCAIVADFRNPQYEAYIVKVGTVYWTVYT